MSSIEDIWSSLLEEENSNKNEYKSRYESIKKANTLTNGKEFSLVDLMNGLENKSSKKRNGDGKKKSKSAISSSTTNKLVHLADSQTGQTEMKGNQTTTPTGNVDENPNNLNGAVLPTVVVDNVNQEKKVILFADLMMRINRHVIGCSSNESGIRRRSLTLLIDEVFYKNSLSERDYGLLFEDIGKSIFRLFADSVEKCRELSLRATLLFFEKVADVTPVLNFFFSAIMQRLPANIGYDEDLEIFVYDKTSHEAYRRGKAVDRQDKINPSEATIVPFTFTETSEEIRLLSYLVMKTLVTRLVQLDALSVLQPYFHELIMYLQVGLRDPFPDVKVIVLETLIFTSKQVQDFESGLKVYATAIVRAILPVLRHRHAKIRAAAVNGIAAYFVVPDKAKRKGAGTSAINDLIGYHEENVLSIASFYKPQVNINYLAELVCDATYQVREAVVIMLDALISELPDRYDHIPRLIPYLLDFLTDDNHDNLVSIAMNCLVKCGKMYEEDHPEDIIERRQYGIDGDSRMNFSKPLPYPFHIQRPRIGIRLFVRGHVKRFLNVLIKEIMNWKSETRLKSVKLLKVCIVLAEESVTIEAANLFPALLKALLYTKYEEGDIAVYEELLEAAELLGRYIHPDVYMHYLIPRLRGDLDIIGDSGMDTNNKVIIMEFLSAMISGTKTKELMPYIPEVITCICSDYIIPRDSITLVSHAVQVMSSILLSCQLIAESENKSLDARSIQTNLKMRDCFEFLYSALIQTSKASSGTQTMHFGKPSNIRKHVIEAFHVLADMFVTTSREDAIDINKRKILQLFRAYEAMYLSKCIEEYCDEENDSLHMISCILASPYYPAHQDVAVFDRTLSFIIDQGRNLLAHGDEDRLEQSKLSTLSQMMTMIFEPLIHSESRFMPADTAKLFDGLFPPEDSVSVSDRDISQLGHLVHSRVSVILRFFVQHNVWTRSKAMDERRLAVFCNILGLRFDEMESFDLTKLNESNDKTALETLPSRELFDMISSVFVPLVASCRRQSYPQIMRQKVVAAIGAIFCILSKSCGLSMTRLKSYRDRQLDDSSLVLAQPLVTLLIEMLNDGSDDVRTTTIRTLYYSVPFIAPDEFAAREDRDGIYCFTKFANMALNEVICTHNFNSIEIQGKGDLVQDLDTVLRSLSILNPSELEAIVRRFLGDKSEMIDDNGRCFMSELIDHASLLAQLNNQ